VRHRNWEWGLIGFYAVLVVQGTVRVDGLSLHAAPSWNYGHLDESLILALLVIGVPAALVAASRTRAAHRAVLIAVAVGALVLAVVLGNTQRKQYLDERYSAAVAPELDTGFRSTPEWKPLQQFGKDTKDARIGVVGRASAFGQYFFYGDDLSNYVQYLGQELSRGTFRQIPNCALLRRTINDGNYDFVIVTPRIRRETSIPPENYWVGEAGNAEPVILTGGATGGTGDLAGVFKIDGRLDPSTCKPAEQDFRVAKGKEQRAKEAEFRALELQVGEDLDADGKVGR
jgi:hypothetical protein